jgi:hypothetical protein
VGDSFYPTAVDCAIAKAVNGMLPECESNPQASVCIVYLFPAFCGDFSSISAGNNTPDIEYCLRRVGLGPCVANPGGAACLSGQFAGIQFVVGGGSNTGSSKRDNPDPLFGDQGQDLIPLEDQFWVGKKRYFRYCNFVSTYLSAGVMKNFINSGIGLLNWFTDLAAQQTQTACHAATALHDLFNITLRDRMNNGCAEAFKPHQVSFVPTFELPEAKFQLSSFGLLNTVIILRRPELFSPTSYLYLMGLERWQRLSKLLLPSIAS